MASSENLASLEPWNSRHAFPDLWVTEAYTRDTETLTKALQKSLYNNSYSFNSNSNSFSSSHSEKLASNPIDPFLNLTSAETAPQTPTVSNVSASDPETVPKRQRNTITGASGKVSKRKSRASKRSQTTFITADPANFRQMVQQVTGIRFGNSQLPMVPVLKPEPQRPGSRLQGSGVGCLPTLDTSALLLDHHQHQAVSGSMIGSVVGTDPIPYEQPLVADCTPGSSGGLDFETFSSFPTLESWKVM